MGHAICRLKNIGVALRMQNDVIIYIFADVQCGEGIKNSGTITRDISRPLDMSLVGSPY